MAAPPPPVAEEGSSVSEFAKANMDVWSLVLCFCDARSISSFACGTTWSSVVFSLRNRSSASDDPVKSTSFRRRWQESLRVGDRLDAMDVEGRWFEADVIGADQFVLLVHYRSWNSTFDQKFHRTCPRLAPLFTHCNDWRPKLKRGQLIEAKKDRCWYLAIVLSVVYPSQRHFGSNNNSNATWSRLSAIGVNSSREHDTLRVVTPNVPNVKLQQNDDLLRWTIHDFDSENIAPLGTHIRPGGAGKHYTTNNITMPMSLMIELMS